MDCADIPVSDQEILQSCVDWFSYFELQTALAEMFEQKLLICQSSQAGVRRYSVAALGKQTSVSYTHLPIVYVLNSSRFLLALIIIEC